MSIITTGINIVATGVNNSISQVQRFGQALTQAERNARSFANGYNSMGSQVEKTGSSLKRAMNADWSGMYSRAINGPTRDLEANLRRVQSMYDRTFREIGNRYQSMVMGSVALSMSGVGLQNMGTSTLGAMKSSLDVARDFETVMAQIQFYGQKTADQMSTIEKDIFDIAYRMPQTASEIGNAFLQAQKTGYDYDSSKVMAEEASKISFMSMGKLDGEESLKYISQMKKFTNAYATEGERLALVQKGITDSLSVGQLTDKLTMTADVSAASIDSLWKTMQSSRSAFDNMGTDMDSMLAIAGVMSDRLQPRAAGQALSSFGRGMNMAEKAKAEGRGTRGAYYSDLTQAMGGGVEFFRNEDGNVDVLKYIEGVATKSREIWGDGVDRTSKLISIFGNSAIDLFHAYDNYAMSGNINMEQMRDKIKDANGHSNKFMETIMNTSYGTEMKLQAVAEQFQILFGGAIRPVFNDILDGLTFVIGKINQFIQAHPKLTKALGYGAGLAGMLLVATGATMLFVGGLLALYASIGNVMTQIVRNTRVLDMLGQGYGSAGAMLKGKLLGPLRLFGVQLLKLSGITFFLWLAWKNDFLRMRTTFNAWKNDISKGLAESKTMFEMYAEGSRGALLASFNGNEKIGGFDNFIANTWTKAKMLWDGIKDIWSDGELPVGKYLMLEDAGLLGIVEKVYEIKTAVMDFWKGFQSGMKDGLEILKTILSPLITAWNWISDKILSIFQHFGYFENVNKGIGSQWEQWGQKAGYILGSAIGIRLALWGWVKAIKLAVSPFTLIWKTTSKIWGLFTKMKNFKLAQTVGNVLKHIAPRPVRNMMNTGRYVARRRFSGDARQGAQSQLPYARPVIDPTTGRQRTRQIGRVTTPEVTYQRRWLQRNNRGGTVIPSRDGQSSSTVRSRGMVGRARDMWLGRAYVPETQTDRRGREYNQIRRRGGGTTRSTADGMVNGRQARTGGLKSVLGRIGSAIIEPLRNQRGAVGRVAPQGPQAPSPRVGRTGGAGRGVGAMFKGVGKGIGKIGGTLGKGLLKGVGGVITKGIPMVFKGALRAIPILGWALLAWDVISAVWSNWDAIKNGAGIAWDWIKTKAGQVWDWAKSKGAQAWDWAKTKSSEAWDSAKTKMSDVWNSAKTKGAEAWNSAKTKATEAWNTAKSKGIEAWNSAKAKVIEVWTSAKTKATEAWGNIKSTASGAISTIKTTVNGVFDGMFGKAQEAWNNVKTFISNNPITQTVKTVTQNVKSTAKSVVQKASDRIKGFFGKGARTGEWKVPKDNMPYNLHAGEMVLTRREAQIMRSMVGNDSNSIADFLLDKPKGEGGDVSVATPQKQIVRPQLKVAQATSTQSTPSGGGSQTFEFKFEQGAIQVANASASEMKKGAKQMFEEFKRMVELDNMRHYKPARPRTR